MIVRRVLRSACLVLPCVLVFVSGCIFSPNKGKMIKPTEGEFRPLTTPVAPLYDIGWCYHNTADGRATVDKYKTLFSPDYRFYFTDINEDPRHIGFYTYNDEVATAESLFTDPMVSSISLNFLTIPSDTTNPEPSDKLGDPPGTVKFVVNAIALDVKRGDTDYVANGSGEYYVSPDSTTNPVTWKIYRWNDMTAVPSTQAPNGSPTVGATRMGGGMHTLSTEPAMGDALRRAAMLADAKAR